jgi:hypothetical protein
MRLRVPEHPLLSFSGFVISLDSLCAFVDLIFVLAWGGGESGGGRGRAVGVGMAHSTA